MANARVVGISSLFYVLLFLVRLPRPATSQTCPGVIKASPSSTTVSEGEMAWFTCTILCTHRLFWFEVGPDTILADDGENIVIETINESDCLSEMDDQNSFSKTLGVKGTSDNNGIVIQCAAFPKCNSCSLQEFYTRAAMLAVEPDEQEITPSPTPSVDISPSPSSCITPESTEVKQLPVVTKFIQESCTSTDVHVVTATLDVVCPQPTVAIGNTPTPSASSSRPACTASTMSLLLACVAVLTMMHLALR